MFLEIGFCFIEVGEVGGWSVSCFLVFSRLLDNIGYLVRFEF